MGVFLGFRHEKSTLFGVLFCFQLGGDYWMEPEPR